MHERPVFPFTADPRTTRFVGDFKGLLNFRNPCFRLYGELELEGDPSTCAARFL